MSDSENLQRIRTSLYGDRSDVPLDDADLISVLLTFPACLVAAADGEIDVTERLFLLNISEELGSEDVGQSPNARLESSERYRAFMWLLNERASYETPILQAIREFLVENPASVVHLRDMLWGMAEASEGISQVEMAEINRICDALDISEETN